MVVYSVGWEVRGRSVAGGDGPLLPPIPQLSMATSLDYLAGMVVRERVRCRQSRWSRFDRCVLCVAEGEWLYWAEAETGRVWRVHRDGSERQLLVEQRAPLQTQPFDSLAGHY